jgi:hypothetical protein
MAARLLDRQVRLLEYLTSGSAIFGEKQAAPIDPALQGIDRSLLNTEARFSYEKRMEKIGAVFPKTFELLGSDEEPILRAFIDACPPVDISQIANARQFRRFLSEYCEGNPRLPSYLSDVAACELACAETRLRDGSSQATGPESPPYPALRRSHGAALLKTTFDIHAIFEGASGDEPAKRETFLAVVAKSGEAQIFELTAEVFDLLAALDQWVALNDLPSADDLVTDLVEAGMLELRR